MKSENRKQKNAPGNNNKPHSKFEQFFITTPKMEISEFDAESTVMSTPDRSQESLIGDVGEKKLLYGVLLRSESSTADNHAPVLGAVLTQPNIKLKNLRSLLCDQISMLPAHFHYLSSKGWKINTNQEDYLDIGHVKSKDNEIHIQRSYDNPRVGIKTIDGTAIGFVFVNHLSSLALLRDAILRQLGNIVSKESSGYQFLDRNKWPISKSQEEDLTLLDVLINGAVTVIPSMFQCSYTYPDRSLEFDVPDSDFALRSPPKKRARIPSLKEITFTSRKDHDRQTSVDVTDNSSDPKQVLISYVRAEAAQHAVSLKRELVDMGFTVYLDVHEIKSGVDWQDSLNFAVTNCEVFVPLVTSRYGDTQWTNREVKLADVLDKFIIPVNFLDHWPPRCLAIQFATTQYIPWKTPEDVQLEEQTEDISDIWDVRFWQPHQVYKTAISIGERIKQGDPEILSPRKDQVEHPSADNSQRRLKKKTSNLRSAPASLVEGLPLSQLSVSRDGPPLIVLCIHPEQHQFGMELKAILEVETYEVWCSSESYDQSLTAINDSYDHLPNSQDDMCFSQKLVSQVSVDLDPKEKEKQLEFQHKADEAGIIVCVLSKAFAASKTSKQQVYYCEHRKKMVLLRYEDFCMPGWMSMLIGTGVFEDVQSVNYKESLLNRIKIALDPEIKDSQVGTVDETEIEAQVRYVRKKIPKELCIYIAGGTKFYHKQTSNICKAVGEKLAEMENIHVATGGFFGVGDTVARSFHTQRAKLNKNYNIWHILPKKDEQDRSHQARQNPDKSFENVPYGNTIFCGQSVRERELIVSRVFDICILIEGGPGAAHEAEQFIWNDHVVIPVKCTGGAAGGKFNVPKEMFNVPPGILEEDWQKVQQNNSSSNDIADSVVNIIQCIRERLKLDSPTYSGKHSPMSLLSKTKSMSPLKRKSSGLSRMNTFVIPGSQGSSNTCGNTCKKD